LSTSEKPVASPPDATRAVTQWRMVHQRSLPAALVLAVAVCVTAVSEVSSRQAIGGLLSEYERELGRRSFNEPAGTPLPREAVAVSAEVYGATMLRDEASRLKEELAQAKGESEKLGQFLSERRERDAALSGSWELITTFRRRLQRLEVIGGGDNGAAAGALMEQFIEARQSREASDAVSKALLEMEDTTLSLLREVSRIAAAMALGVGYDRDSKHMGLIQAAANVDVSLKLLGIRFADAKVQSAELRTAALDFITELQGLEQINYERRLAPSDFIVDERRPSDLGPYKSGREIAGTKTPPPAVPGSQTEAVAAAKAAGHKVKVAAAKLRSALAAMDAPDARLTAWSFADDVLHAITLARTTTLLAVAVVLAGLIGSIITTLRSSGEKRLTSPALGLAAGFVAFLAIRGGKAALLADGVGEPPMINPYSFAFMGLLAGLFTERGYALLSYLVDELTGRIKLAMEAQRTQDSGSSNVGEQLPSADSTNSDDSSAEPKPVPVQPKLPSQPPPVLTALPNK
jgi:hypothetical protein